MQMGGTRLMPLLKFVFLTGWEFAWWCSVLQYRTRFVFASVLLAQFCALTFDCVWELLVSAGSRTLRLGSGLPDVHNWSLGPRNLPFVLWRADPSLCLKASTLKLVVI